MNESKNIPEGCKLVAILYGSGESAEWSLEVHNLEGETVALLAWPIAFGEWVSGKFLKKSGFECRRA